jgi:hypothetical protein
MHTNIFSIPRPSKKHKFGFYVRKYTIWQPWSEQECPFYCQAREEKSTGRVVYVEMETGAMGCEIESGQGCTYM